MIPSPKDMLMRKQAAELNVTEPCLGGSEYVGVREMMVIEMILYVRINMGGWTKFPHQNIRLLLTLRGQFVIKH